MTGSHFFGPRAGKIGDDLGQTLALCGIGDKDRRDLVEKCGFS